MLLWIIICHILKIKFNLVMKTLIKIILSNNNNKIHLTNRIKINNKCNKWIIIKNKILLSQHLD